MIVYIIYIILYYFILFYLILKFIILYYIISCNTFLHLFLIEAFAFTPDPRNTPSAGRPAASQHGLRLNRSFVSPPDEPRGKASSEPIW